MQHAKATVAQPKRVAIVQSSMIMGGRLQVVLALTKCLNQLGIVPDVVTQRLKFDPDQIVARYETDVQLRFRKLPLYILLPGEFSIASFNIRLQRLGSQYDLLVNNSNSLVFLPQQVNVLTYMHFPRKYRVHANVSNIHDPHAKPFARWSIYGAYNTLARALYRLSHPVSGHGIVCNSAYTKWALKKVYPQLEGDIPVIPPPVAIEAYKSANRNRSAAVTTVGRFDYYKGQMDQIQIAAELPWLTFHIIGFVTDRRYFERCQSYIEEHQIRNVKLHPHASHEEMVGYLKTSRYFLHTTVNEPFGVTAVQAIAAGCIPLVPDSGGQRETVTIDHLRFQRFGDVVQMVEELEQETPDSREHMVATLQQHIRQYDLDTFIERMRPLLENRLGLGGTS